MQWITVPLFVLLVFFLPTKTVAGCKVTPTPMASLNTDSMIGKWYEYKYAVRMYKTEGKCASYEFSKGMFKGSLHMKVSELVHDHEVLDIAILTKQDKNDKSGRFDITRFQYSRSKERIILLTRVRDGSCLDSAKLKKVNEALEEFEYEGTDDSGSKTEETLQVSDMTNIDQKGCGESTNRR